MSQREKELTGLSNNVRLVVTLKDTGELVGYCGVGKHSDLPETGVAYVISRPHQNRGYVGYGQAGSEGIRMMSDVLFSSPSPGPETMQSILVVQHCQSQHHLDGQRRFPDRHNGLTELGRAQAQAVARRIADLATDRDVRLYSSDMTRARETAYIVGSVLGREPVLQQELREWSGPRDLDCETQTPWDEPEPDESLFDCRPYPGC